MEDEKKVEEKVEDEDLKEEKETPSEESTDDKPTPKEGETPLKKEGEEEAEEETPIEEEVLSDDEKVAEMLKDGTPADKEIKVKKSKYDENADKAKLYDAFAPVLDKLQKNPDILDKLVKDKDGETVEARIKRLEQSRIEDKRKETEIVLRNAITVWPDFHKSWNQVRPIADSLEKQGTSYTEAIQRAYFAVNPDAASQDNRLVDQAQQMQNAQGTFASSIGATKVVQEKSEGYPMSEEDKETARAMGIKPELYAKHANHLKGLAL